MFLPLRPTIPVLLVLLQVGGHLLLLLVLRPHVNQSPAADAKDSAHFLQRRYLHIKMSKCSLVFFRLLGQHD